MPLRQMLVGDDGAGHWPSRAVTALLDSFFNRCRQTIRVRQVGQMPGIETERQPDIARRDHGVLTGRADGLIAHRLDVDTIRLSGTCRSHM